MIDEIKAEVYALDGYVSTAYLDPEKADGLRDGEWKHTGTRLTARWDDATERWYEVAKPMSAERLEEIRGRAGGATPGPWEAEHCGYDVYETATDYGDVVAECGLRVADARFIAHARTDVPALLAEVDRLRAQVADYENGINWGTSCIGCAKQLDVHYDGWVQGHRAGLREGWERGYDSGSFNARHCNYQASRFNPYAEAL